jgi:antitoxin MazE
METSLALIIDRPILDLLKIDDETPLEHHDRREAIDQPAAARRRKFEAAREVIHRRYGAAFKQLAE